MTIGSVILEKKFYKNRLPGTKDQLKGHSRNRTVDSLQFKRSAYNVKDNRNLVLVHYEGDETVYVPVTHGNSNKDNASEYTLLLNKLAVFLNKSFEIRKNHTLQI